MRSGLAAVGDHAAQADALRVTQAAISHQIEALEDRLRVSLSSPLADWQDPPTNVVQRSWAPGQPDRRLLQQNGGSPRYNAVMYLEHIALALTIQILVGRLTGNWWAGAALASAYFVGREVTQAEYRWIELYGAGLRANMPWWGPFDLRVWTKLDQWIDWIGPVAVTCGLAWAVGVRSQKR